MHSVRIDEQGLHIQTKSVKTDNYFFLFWRKGLLSTRQRPMHWPQQGESYHEAVARVRTEERAKLGPPW